MTFEKTNSEAIRTNEMLDRVSIPVSISRLQFHNKHAKENKVSFKFNCIVILLHNGKYRMGDALEHLLSKIENREIVQP